jgi:hypothetical protein
LSAINTATFLSILWILAATSIFFFTSIKLMKRRLII